jgi:hypothetical protein
MMAEPTDASAAICFDELEVRTEISVPGIAGFRGDYTTMQNRPDFMLP